MALRPAFRPITAWSYSRYGKYKQCPYAFYCLYILKLPEPKGAALVRGAEVHDEAKFYLQNVTRIIPKSLKLFEPEIKRLRTKFKKEPGSVIVEDNWAFRADWSGTQWNNWNDCWLRVKLDVAERDGNTVIITDFKTGKFRSDNREDYMEQLSLYGVAALTVFSHVSDLKVTTRLMYLDNGVVYPDKEEAPVYTAKDVRSMQKDWMKKVKPLFVDKTFAPKPNKWCYSCHYRKDNGGPCIY